MENLGEIKIKINNHNKIIKMSQNGIKIDKINQIGV